MIVRRLAAGVVVAALVAAGAVGVAGASSSGHHHDGARFRRMEARVARVEAIARAGVLPASFTCAKATKDLAKISKAESWINGYIPRAQARQAAALAAGEARRAHVIAHRIAEARRAEAALETVGSLITAACPT
jgi:hypothetical protein